jgi:hypothetical protein
MGDRQPTFDMRNSTLSGNTFGAKSSVTGNVFHIGSQSGRGTLDDLRRALAAARPDLLAAAPDDTSAELERRLEHLEQELAVDEPAGEVTTSLWGRIRSLAGPLAATANIAQVTDLMVTLFQP